MAMSKSNPFLMTVLTRVVIAFFGAMLMIRVDTGGTVWLKFTLYVLLFLALQTTVRRFRNDMLIRKS